MSTVTDEPRKTPATSKQPRPKPTLIIEREYDFDEERCIKGLARILDIEIPSVRRV